MHRLAVHEFRSLISESGDIVKLKSLRSENAGEYIYNDFRRYLSECGVKHQLTVAYTPQQNGVVEQMNRTIVNLARSMLHQKSIYKKF